MWFSGFVKTKNSFENFVNFLKIKIQGVDAEQFFIALAIRHHFFTILGQKK